MLSQGTAGWLWNSPLPNQDLQHFSPYQNQSCVRTLEIIKEALEELSWSICQCWIQRPVSTVTGCATDTVEHHLIASFRLAGGEKGKSQQYVWITFFLSLVLSHTPVWCTLSGALLPSLDSIRAASGVFLCSFTMLWISLKHQWQAGEAAIGARG